MTKQFLEFNNFSHSTLIATFFYIISRTELQSILEKSNPFWQQDDSSIKIIEVEKDMCERKIKRKIRLRNRLQLFRRNNQQRQLQTHNCFEILDSEEIFSGRISEKLLNDSVCEFTNSKGIFELSLSEMETLIVRLHVEYDTSNINHIENTKDQCENIFQET